MRRRRALRALTARALTRWATVERRAPDPVSAWTDGNTLDAATWLKAGTTVVPDAVLAPDGALSMDRVVERASSGAHSVQRFLGAEAHAGRPQTVTFYLKAGERHAFLVSAQGADAKLYGLILDLSTGLASTGATPPDFAVVDVGGGVSWVRFTLPNVGTGATAPYWMLQSLNEQNASQYLGDTSKGYYLWGIEYFPDNDGSTLLPAFSVNTESRLRMGLGNFRTPGVGPGGKTDIIYTVAGPYAPTPLTVADDVEAADRYDVLLVWNLVGNRDRWAPNKHYDPDLYDTRTQRFLNIPAVADALRRRRAVIMLVDEPNHTDFGDPSTISPKDVNDMGLLVKGYWPGAITFVRMASTFLAVSGWRNVDGISVPPPGGYTGVDYGFSHYHAGHTDETPLAYYTREQSDFATVDLGMIPGLNFFEGGIIALRDGVQPCWDVENNQASSGVIAAINGNTGIAPGTHIPCGDPRIGDTLHTVVANPEWVRRVAEVAATFPAAPFFSGFSFASPSSGANQQWEIDLQGRSDMVAALRDAIIAMAGRTNATGWRTIK